MPGDRFSPEIGHDSRAALRLDTGLVEAGQEKLTLEQNIIRLFEQWREPVYQYLVIVFGYPAEAEEVVQDAFLQLYRTLRTGQSIQNQRGWLFRVAHNLAINRRKHEKFYDPLDEGAWEQLRRALPDAAPNPEQRVLQQEEFARLHMAMKRLSLQERQCLHLRAEGFRYGEIADILGVNDRTVNEYLRRAMQKLRKQNE